MGGPGEVLTLDKVLDLRKEKVLNLVKELGMGNQKAQVVLCLDYSGSMGSMYRNGSVQKLVERLLPIGMAFDDNEEVEFFIFENGYKELPEPLVRSNIAGYIDSKVLNKYSMGGTEYAPIIRAILSKFGKPEKKGGVFGIGGKTTYGKLDYPVYVIFITDGDCSDKEESRKAITEASNAGIFFQFVGLGSPSLFGFLQEMDTMSGRFIDNANFFAVNNLSQKTDDDLYNLLLKEFPSYVTEARSKGLIK